MTWRRRRRADEQRAQLAADVRRVAGFADAALDHARRLGAEVPDDVAASVPLWWHWHRRLVAWAKEEGERQ